jgi:extracellular factor (EF) 3-hydroxypalmitic acid methyl ester biosynthesis protein
MDEPQNFRKFELIDPTSLKPGRAEHEFLTGGEGKAINYRQPRYRVQDLLNEVHHLNPRVISDLFEGELVDFAITGASCLTDADAPVISGQVVDKIWIMVGDDTYYTGSARVVHVTPALGEAARNRAQVGLQLLDGVMDIDRVRRVKSDAEVAAEMRKTRVILARQDVSERYKRCVADFLYVVQKFRYILSRQEHDLERVSYDARGEMERETLQTAWDNFRITIGETQQNLEDLTKNHYFDREFQEIHRQFTLPLVTPHVVSAPVLYHAWAKPLGYAGDHVLMSYIYEKRWEGASLFGKLMHRYGVEHPMSETVRRRRDLLIERISKAVEGHGAGDGETPCRVLSLGSGPAREVADFARDYRGKVPVHFTLVDQDNSALGFANRHISPLVVRADTRIQVQYLYLAFAQLLRNKDLFHSLPEVDLVYCSGLFDYLSTGKAKMLMNRLMAKVAPGGHLVVGNFSSPPPAAWTTTYLLDWNLRYRTLAEMEELATEVADQCETTEVVTEATGMCYFVVVRKKRDG